jgi:flagellar protein FlgJ
MSNPIGSPVLPAAQMTAAASTANTYTDLNGLTALNKDPKSPQAIQAVAQQVDALFLQMMLKSMRDASTDGGGSESNEMSMYHDMFDKQVALTLSQHHGLGLGALLARQLSAASAQRQPAAGQPAAGQPVQGQPANGHSAAPEQLPSGVPAARPRNMASASLLQTASRFVEQVLPSIKRAAQALGVSPLGMLAQAALETGWGQRMARTVDGDSSLNMFGIKADDAWEGARAGATTVEFSGGVATPRHAAFRAYPSIDDSVSDFAGLLRSSPRYRHTLAAGGNAQGYVEGIGRSGYATDPDYANKLNDVLNGSTLRTALNNSSVKL